MLNAGRWAALALLVAVPGTLLAGGGPGSLSGYGNIGMYAAHGQPGCGGGLMPGNGSPFVPKSQPWILQAAPWYLYWPYDAHFQTPAPVFAPYHPPHMLGAVGPQAYYPGFGAVPHGGYNGYPTQGDPYAAPTTPPTGTAGQPGTMPPVGGTTALR